MKSRSVKMAFTSLAACWFVLGASAAFAEECYKLVHGKGNPVCRKFGQNLNSFCDQPPMRCELAIHPDFAKDFSFPKWESLDPLANIELVAELVRSLASVAHDCTGECDKNWRELQWQKYKPKLLEGARYGCIHFSRARLDINHDGRKELVFRLMGKDCPAPSDGQLSYSNDRPNLVVLNEETGKFDRDFVRGLSLTPLDIVLHQGRVSFTYYDSYADRWHILESISGPGIKQFHIIHRPICEYKIMDKGRNK